MRALRIPLAALVFLTLTASCGMGPDGIVCEVGCEEAAEDETAPPDLLETDQAIALPPIAQPAEESLDAGEGDDGSTDAVAFDDAAAADAGTDRTDAAAATADAAAAAPDAARRPGLLDTSIVKLIVEPEGSGRDDAGQSFVDRNYWNFCAPGAVTAALYYWVPERVTGWRAGYFKEPAHRPSTIPAAGTYWKSDSRANSYRAYGRAYLMHLAMQVEPPSFVAPGMVPFDAYPTHGSNLVDIRDTLNWEASGHASNWRTFFYAIVYTGSLTANKLHHDIKQDIDGGHALVVTVDTGYLPNWSRSLSHAITVVGYDDEAKTYKYVDTCGVRCNGSSRSRNGGVWTIGQTRLYNAVKANGMGYVW
ncbi:MAG: hypothetical protein JXR83_07230 [Deltaproteobacteria bacterium]|nr:hypothetical protein [Deltaproteobacteria bacterium]